ncbi:MAG TPA: hypothetical protein VG125_27780 [Pirellulales bacterium]|jgi:hypothetical protein|nr:hypothetical protein [Pirellulales bacterium]
MMREARAIERRLRRRVRPLVEASPSLWVEYKKARRARRPSLAAVVFMPIAVVLGIPVALFVVPVFLAWRCVVNGGTDYLLAASGWSSLIVAMLVSWLTHFLLYTDGPFLALFPVADRVIAGRARFLVLLASLPLVVWVIHPFAFAAWHEGMPLDGWLIAIAVSLLQGLVVFAAGFSMACVGPRTWYCLPLAVALLMGELTIVAPPAQNWLIKDVLYLLTPGGWIAAAYGRGWLAAEPLGWLGLVPAVLLLGVFRYVWKELPETYVAEEQQPQEPRDWLAWIAGDIPLNEGNPAGGIDPDRTIRSRSFLQPREVFPREWMARLARRVLTPEEQAIVEWAGPDDSVVAEDHVVLSHLVVVAFLAGLTGWIPISCLGLVTGALLMAAFLQELPGRRWRGFDPQLVGGMLIPRYLSLPIGYRTLCRALFKHWCLRLLPFVPALAMAALCDVTAMGAAPATLLPAVIAALSILLCVPAWRGIAPLVLDALPWRRAHYTIAMLVLAFLSFFATVAQVLLFLEAFLGRLPALPGPMLLTLAACLAAVGMLSTYLLWRLCCRLEAKGYCGVAQWSRPLGLWAHLDWPRWEHGWQQPRDSNRRALRERFGRFWWLPRYMIEVKQEQGA